LDLAVGLGITSSAVTRLLLTLEKAGLVGREPPPTDARAAHAMLTAAGLERAEDAEVTAAAVAADLIGERLSRQQVLTLARLLARVAATHVP
jgi:DNA-binding MarR family transcriptional regulator